LFRVNVNGYKRKKERMVKVKLSSIKTKGFSACVFLRPWTIFPGIAPTYVLLCPFISATSASPPTLNLKNSRERVRAIDFPIEVFPTPGSQEMRGGQCLLFAAIFGFNLKDGKGDLEGPQDTRFFHGLFPSAGRPQ